MFYARLKDESGMALIVALIAAMLGSLLVASYMSVVTNETRNSVWQKQRAQSLFLAEAGIEKCLYYLNNPGERPREWVDSDEQLLPTPLEIKEFLEFGSYKIALHDSKEIPWLPKSFYLIRSRGIIPLIGRANIVHKVSCVVTNVDIEASIPAAISICDAYDPEDEVSQFKSTQWVVSGKDVDDASGRSGVMGIAVANPDDKVDAQLDSRVIQVEGADVNDVEGDGDYTFHGAKSIIYAPSLPQDLREYVDAFCSNEKRYKDITGTNLLDGELLGSPDHYQVLYADLSGQKRPLLLPGNRTGYGVLIVRGPGQLTIAGNAEWRGLVLCTGDGDIQLAGGGKTLSHIYGALMVDNCTVTINGTADVRYSSSALEGLTEQLMPYEVRSWSEGWGNAL